MWVTLKIFVKGHTSCLITNSLWATLHILWKALSSHPFLLPSASEWYCTFCEHYSHHIFSYDQQDASDIAHFVKGSLIMSFFMTNSEWVMLHILWKAVSSHCYLWPTGCEWKKLHICSMAVLSHLFLWPTGSEWHYMFCVRQSHHILSYDQQKVSDIQYICCVRQSHHIFSYDQQLVSDILHCTFCVMQSHHIFSYDQ